MKNKKAEESTSYLGGKTINVILGVVVALFIVFVIGKLAYNYVQGETDLQKAGGQLQNILEKIDYVRNDRISDSINVYFPEGWFLKSDDGDNNAGQGEVKTNILDAQCLMRSCLCICEDVYCKSENRVCKGFDYRVEIENGYYVTGGGNIAGAGSTNYLNTIKIKSIERLRIDKINPANEEDYVRIKRIQ